MHQQRTEPAQGNPTARNPLAPTIFHQAWWLDTVAGGRWQAVEAVIDGRVAGRFPFVLHRVAGPHRLCGMPAMTHCLGPAISLCPQRPPPNE